MVAGTVVGAAAGIARHPGSVDAAGAHRSVRALPVLCLCRAGIHELPVGLAAAGERVSGDISDRRIADRRLALPLAGVPLSVPGGRREAPLRRPDVARLNRARVSLLDATAADPARVVCGATSGLAAHGGTAATLVVELGVVFLIFLPRRPRASRRCLRAAVAIADRADRQLQLLQSAHDAVVRLSVRRCGAAPRSSRGGCSAGRKLVRRTPERTAATIAGRRSRLLWCRSGSTGSGRHSRAPTCRCSAALTRPCRRCSSSIPTDCSRS